MAEKATYSPTSYMSRQSYTSRLHLLAESPLVLAHTRFVGLSIECSNPAAVVTVKVALSEGATFTEVVTLEGTGDYRWPDVDGMNRLYNAKYIEITWDVGDITVFQKG